MLEAGRLIRVGNRVFIGPLLWTKLIPFEARVNKQGWRRFVRFQKSRTVLWAHRYSDFGEILRVPLKISVSLLCPRLSRMHLRFFHSNQPMRHNNIPMMLFAVIEKNEQSNGNLAHSAAAEIDQVNSRNIDPYLANRYLIL